MGASSKIRPHQTTGHTVHVYRGNASGKSIGLHRAGAKRPSWKRLMDLTGTPSQMGRNGRRPVPLIPLTDPPGYHRR